MLLTEWNWDDALEVRYEEGTENGLKITDQNALLKGLSVETVHEITGLDIEIIKQLAAGE